MLAASVPLGTVPFAEAARHGFIGVSFLKSLVAIGILTNGDAYEFLASIETVAHEAVHDIAALNNGSLASADFFCKYGHLRPGTYDITSYRYDERPDLYLGHSIRTVEKRPIFKLSAQKRDAIQKVLNGLDASLSANLLLEYIETAIKLRESAKFRFTHAVSDCLRRIVDWGTERDISRQMLAYLSIDDILDSDTDRRAIEARIAQARERHEIGRMVRLPHLIADERDVDVVRLPLGKPTFITRLCVAARMAYLRTNATVDIEGRIVVIESADPGFDWIFSHNIAGLVTKFGGANSHMAIRCAEFRIPAAIGCGERLFAGLLDAEILMLDCAAQTVRAS